MDRRVSWRPLPIVLLLPALLVAGCVGDPPPTGVACPADANAEVGPQGNITLSWDPVPDAESYPILRSGPDAEPTLVANVSAPNTSYTDPSADAGVTYEYSVHSWNGTARSTDCPATEITAVPFFPSLAATAAIGVLVALVVLGFQNRV